MPVHRAAASELSTELIHLIKKVEAFRHHAPRPHNGLEPSAYPVLFVLRRGPARISAIAEFVHSDVSTISRQVTGLVGHGLVAKVSDPDDGRAQMVALTTQGEDLLRRLQDERSRWIQDMLVDWDDADVRSFAGYLHDFVGALTIELDRVRCHGTAHLADASATTRKDPS